MVLSLSRDSLPAGAAFGPVALPGSKSVTNRALLLAASAPGRSRICGALEAEDTHWMREALIALGVPMQMDPSGWQITGIARPAPAASLWMGASGTTLRFLLPWLAVHGTGPVEVEGEPRLFERPLDPLLNALAALGAHWTPTLRGGRLLPTDPPEYLDLEVDSSLSSQFLSGLAMAAASLPRGGRLRWHHRPASASYLALTARWMHTFGCESRLEENRWEISGGGLRATNVEIPADWSGAAAFLAAAAVTGREVAVGSLDPADEQRDRDLVAILESAGCSATWSGNRLTLRGPLRTGLRADLEACPDLGPVLAATAALAPDLSELSGLQTLPFKECDRLDASAELVRWLGGQAEVFDARALRIQPGAPRAENRPPFDPRRDHRMAFAAAVGALRHGGSLADPDCVGKTFPGFWSVWSRMLQGLP